MSAITVSELLRQLVSEEFAQAFDEIDVKVTDGQERSTDLDSASKNYLGRTNNQAISSVELKEAIIVSIGTRPWQFTLIATGKWIRYPVLLICAAIAAYLIGPDVAWYFLKFLPGV